MHEQYWFQQEIKEVEKKLETNLEKGLTEEQIIQKKQKYGLRKKQ